MDLSIIKSKEFPELNSYYKKIKSCNPCINKNHNLSSLNKFKLDTAINHLKNFIKIISNQYSLSSKKIVFMSKEKLLLNGSANGK